MIAYVKGKLAKVDPTHAIIDIQGIGYEVMISLNTFSKIKDLKECKLYTHFHVKEDAQLLYGFFEEQEKGIFRHLISISGVGPNTALMVSSSLTVEEIKKAIVNDDVKTIQSIKGIGAKTAQRIILELKDKIKKEYQEGEISDLTKPVLNPIADEAITALLTLGYTKTQAEKSIRQILKNNSNDISLEELIKRALKG
ncbi:MAG TPA: Holliday junction branch migration protein RuvA [Cytophagales bacterium]|jgi:Holliday junction DNA helicase RuvA|nr:Holliday junction branch migration protein RuvA [Cytophagales bacterium]